MPTLTTRIEKLFPYGTFPVDPAFSECYTQDYSRAQRYSLPDALPSHHPLLRQLEGVYPLHYSLPPWWHTRIAQMEPDSLKPLLATISTQEFRAGCFDQARWKAFRESLSEEERRCLPASPKITALLEGTDWAAHFWNRGPADTADRFNLVISTRPLDFLYMSNGREWRSCQHMWNGAENHHLPGNFYDTGVAVAMALLPNTTVTESASVLVRTTLRVFRYQEQTIIAIGRTYHNNETLAFLFLCQLARFFDSRQLCWGMMIDVNTLDYCREGFLGPELCQRLDEQVFVEGEPCWFPQGWYVPYVDGGDRQWERDWEHDDDEYYCTQLSATVRLMRPLALPQASFHTRFTLARLASAGMLPHFL
jgi:hypothetical protein